MNVVLKLDIGDILALAMIGFAVFVWVSIIVVGKIIDIKDNLKKKFKRGEEEDKE